MFVLYLLPCTIALSTVLLVDWNNPCPPNRNLHLWALLQVSASFPVTSSGLVYFSFL